MSAYKSPFFSSTSKKPSFFEEMRKRNFNETKTSDPSSSDDKSERDHKEVSNGGVSSRGTTSSSKQGVSSGIGGLDYVIPPQVSNVTQLSSQPPPQTEETTPTQPVPKPRVKRNSVKTPPTNTSPVRTPPMNNSPVQTPPSQPPQPKPRTRSFDNNDDFQIIRSKTPPITSSPTPTPPVPSPRKNVKKEVKLNDSPRLQAYSKGTKEYKAAQKKDYRPSSANSPPSTVVTPPTLSPYLPSPSKDIPKLPFHHITLDEGPRSIINVIDLDIQTSIRSQYLTKEEMEENEEDSDEETNKQIELIEATPFIKTQDDKPTPTITELTRGEKPAPPKPPRARSRSPSPGVKRKQSSPVIPHPSGVGNCDPTLGLTKSQSFVEDKDKKQKKSIFKSPFNIRKKTSVKKGGSWDLPQEGTNEPDSESIVSEAGTLSPIQYPLHKTKQVKDLKAILAKAGPLIDVNKRDIQYNTPLHYILKKRRSQRCELIMALLQTGRVDVDSRDVEDNTPLHIAAQINDHKCGAILLAFNANPFITNSQGLKPIDLTEEGSSLHNLLSQQCQPCSDDCVTLSSLPEVVVPLDPQELANERIGRLLQPDKVNGFIQQLGDKIREIELDRFSSAPPSLNALSRGEDDFRQCLHDQKFYLNKWKWTSGSRVLFLDGGGIRGLIQIEVLMELERRTGRRVTELFDWIIGTSTGGIVALGLVYGGKSLQEMRNFYFTIKNEVFGGGIAGTFINMNQKSKKLEKILKDGFGKEMKMSDVTHPRVMICAVDKQRSPLRVVFFNNFMDDKKELKDILVWKAARATSAAPMYFTDCDGRYVDGGVLANNPCDIAMTHIYEYNQEKNLPKRHFALAVSIGTGIFPERDLGSGDGKEYGLLNLKKQLSVVKELTRLFMETLAHSEIAAKNFAAHFKDEIPFFRFNPLLRNAVTTGETDDVQLIDMLLVTKLYLADKDTQKQLNQIVEIFKRLQSDK